MIQKIRLQNFRNLPDSVFEFSNNTTVIIGPNAAGKTNLLESIFMLSTGKSFKANLETDLIKNNFNFARIKGLVNENQKLEIVISKTSHKKFLVNNVSKRLIDFTGNLKTVLFAPQDLDLVTSSPSIRRKFLDNVLSLVDHDYHRAILSYEKGLRQRNKLLLKIREGEASVSQLLFWNQLLIKNADYISNKRDFFINFINQFNNNYLLSYDKSIISPARLEKYKTAEIASGKTLVGPHRDDFIFQENDRDLANFGSRGEQRMAVLWLKTAELSFIEEQPKVKPVLLLDDIFSELDEKHRQKVYEIAKKGQTIITTADKDFIKNFDVDTKITLQ